MSLEIPGQPAPAAPTVDALLRDGDSEVFRRLVASVRDYAIFVLTPEGRIASWNDGAERIKGYRAEEIIGRHFSSFYTPEAVATGWPDEELRRATALGRFEDEGWRVRKNGTRFWANVVISPLRGAHGELLGFSKVTRDLTERRRHEEQLREREENLRLIVEGVADHAMFLLDAEGRIRNWNAGAERLLGFGTQEAVGRDVALLYTPEDAKAGRAVAELGAARASGSSRLEGWRQRADGTRFWADVTTTTVQRGEADPLRGFVQIIRDLSERRRVEQLEDEGRRIGGFIAMLSHELRNPLAPIRNAASLLRRRADNPDVAWCADLIERQVGHMARLVDDLLDVSRVTSGKIRLERAPLELGTLVRAAVDGVRDTVQGYGHALVLALPEYPVHVLGDATRLTQVVVNLVTNAAKYTPPGGRIRVTLDEDGALATLQVADNGMGMSEALLQRAFEPFVQGERALDRAEGGLGIGLTLVRSIAELHGGAASAASAGPGQGSTLTVTLPLERPSPAVQRPLQAVVVAPRRVLVVDDGHDAAESLAMLLRMHGHEVRVAYDGPQALRYAATLLPQVVLLDIGLPGMSGYEVARALRALPGLGDVRLIAVTGYGQLQDRETALAAGFERHLTKPVDTDLLLALLG